MSSDEITQPMPGHDEIPRPQWERPGDWPGYELVEEIGRGGMGVVYRARDLAMNREVAVKILLERYAPESTTAERFVTEAQITGQLQHPGIPAVYHVGHLPSRRPFLAMKLIKGQTLDTLLKSDQPLNAPAVFESIAQAVGYAHAHGVIHRDLKPANVMVGSFGELQVMDWGLAKVLTRKIETRDGLESTARESVAALTEILPLRDSDCSFTIAGSVMGTPAYMAPEQAAGEVDKVDRRSDVFGLGAILCALLTGEPPFSGRDAESVRLAAVRGKMEAALARLDACGAEPDVVGLCKRCLSFEPADRPADASAVAAEIAGLRADADDRARQADLARARAEVQAEEQRKRRRLMQSAAVGVAVVLLLGIVGTTLGLVRANQARRDAQAARNVAETSLAETMAVLDFVESKVFAAARPEGIKGGLGHNVTLRRAIESAVPSVEEGFRDQPLIEARLRYTLGISFTYLGQPEAARAMFQRARDLYKANLGPDDPNTLQSMHYLAVSYAALGRYNESVNLHEETLALQKLKLGLENTQTIWSMNTLAADYAALGLYPKALSLLEDVLAVWKSTLGDDHEYTLQARTDQSTVYMALGRYQDALKLREKTLAQLKFKLGIDHPDTLVGMSDLAVSYAVLGRHQDAIKLREETLALRRGKLGLDHHDTLVSMSDLAVSYAAVDRLQDALELREKTLALRKSQLGLDHPETLVSMSDLAASYAATNRHQEALKLREETLALRKSKLGPEHPHTLVSMNDLATSYAATGRMPEAFKLREQTLELRKAKLGPSHPDTLWSMLDLAVSFLALNRDAEGVALIDDCIRTAKVNPVDPRLLSTLIDLRLRHFQLKLDAAGCRTTAEIWDRLNLTDPLNLYIAARNWAVTADVIGHVSDTKAADQAIAGLREAIKAGFKDRKRIENDIDLNALRTHQDFRNLIESLHESSNR